MPKQPKFPFDPEFQQLLIAYTLLDKNGYRAIELYHDTYFTLIHHQIIVKCLKTYFKEKHNLPKSNILLKEYIRIAFNTKEFADLVLPEDKKTIIKLIDQIYETVIKDGDEILLAASKFKAYVQLKLTLEKIDLTDFASYENVANKVKRAILIENFSKLNRGTFIIADIANRQSERYFNDSTFPTPFKQLNQSTNGGGYDKQSVSVVIGPEKFFKTGFMINIARGYLKMRKKVLYIDLENGQETLAVRMEQSLMKLTKLEIKSGEYDKKVQKQFRKYKRMGSEVDIHRMDAYSTTALDIENYMDDQYREFGIVYEILIIDYAAIAASISGSKEDNQRIGDVYLDIKNLAKRKNLEHVWIPHHLTREGKKRIETCYHTNDTAKCIDINRHVDNMFGINYTEDEYNAGVMRLEVIQQRDGIPDHTCWFFVDRSLQYCREFSREELHKYYEETKKTTPTQILNSDI